MQNPFTKRKPPIPPPLPGLQSLTDLQELSPDRLEVRVEHGEHVASVRGRPIPLDAFAVDAELFGGNAPSIARAAGIPVACAKELLNHPYVKRARAEAAKRIKDDGSISAMSGLLVRRALPALYEIALDASATPRDRIAAVDSLARIAELGKAKPSSTVNISAEDNRRVVFEAIPEGYLPSGVLKPPFPVEAKVAPKPSNAPRALDGGAASGNNAGDAP